MRQYDNPPHKLPMGTITLLWFLGKFIYLSFFNFRNIEALQFQFYFYLHYFQFNLINFILEQNFFHLLEIIFFNL